MNTKQLTQDARLIAEASYQHESERSSYVGGALSGFRSEDDRTLEELEPRAEGEACPAEAWQDGFRYGQRLARGDDEDWSFPETESCGTLVDYGDTPRHEDLIERLENEGLLIYGEEV